MARYLAVGVFLGDEVLPRPPHTQTQTPLTVALHLDPP